MKKITALILALMMSVCLFAGCKKDEATGSGKTSITVGISADPTTLAPWDNNSGGRIAVLPNIYQPLLARETLGGELKLALASSYELENESCVFHLYDNITDSAGNKLTASDVVFSYNTAKEAGSAIARTINNYLKSIEAVNDTTVRMTFTSDLSKVLNAFADMVTQMFVVTEKSFKDSGDGMAIKAVGTTQYKIKEYTTGSHLTMEKVEKYWQDSGKIVDMYKANVDTIRYEFITEAAQMAIALQTGTIDMTTSVAPADLALFTAGGQSANAFNVSKVPQNLTYTWAPNASSDSMMNNLNLRMAIAYCYDAQDVIKGAFQGEAMAVAAPGNSKFPDYSKDWDSQPYYSYDAAKAKQYLDAYLAESGKKASDVTIRILTGNEARMKDVSEILQGAILKLGIGCDLNVFDNATINGEKLPDSTGWDIYVNTWANPAYIANMWRNTLDTRNSNNEGASMNFIKDAELQRMMELVSTETGHTVANMTELRNYMTDNVYFMGICVDYMNMVHAKYVTNLFIEVRMNIMPGACTYDWSKKS